MSLYEGHIIDVWRPEYDEDTKDNGIPTLVLKDFPCRFHPMSNREKIAIGVMDISIDMAKVYTRHGNYTLFSGGRPYWGEIEFKLNDILVWKAYETYWQISQPPLHYTLPRGHWKLYTEGSDTVQKEIQDYYGL